LETEIDVLLVYTNAEKIDYDDTLYIWGVGSVRAEQINSGKPGMHYEAFRFDLSRFLMRQQMNKHCDAAKET